MQPAIDLAAAESAFGAAVGRTPAMGRDRAGPSLPVPGLDWTVGEVAAHLVSDHGADPDHRRDAYALAYVGAAEQLSSAAARTTAPNDAPFSTYTQRDPQQLADGLVPLTLSAVVTTSRVPGHLYGKASRCSIPMQLRARPESLRVLGALVEKHLTTPQQYPLSLAALVTACNQSTNRDPVVTFDEATVMAAVDELKAQRLVRFVLPSHGRSVVRFRHVLDETLALDAAECALLAVLMLRGPQTVGELRLRTDRMAEFDSLGELERELTRLAGREEPLVANVGRRPGQKEERWACTLAAPLVAGALPAEYSADTSIEDGEYRHPGTGGETPALLPRSRNGAQRPGRLGGRGSRVAGRPGRVAGVARRLSINDRSRRLQAAQRNVLWQTPIEPPLGRRLTYDRARPVKERQSQLWARP